MDNPILLWKGENNAIDSIHGLTGDIIGDLSYSNGIKDKCFNFGTLGAISVPYNSLFNFSPTDQFTIRIYFKAPYFLYDNFNDWKNTGSCLLSKGANNGGYFQNFDWGLWISKAGILIASNYTNWLIFPIVINLDCWYFLSWIYNSGINRIYIDENEIKISPSIYYINQNNYPLIFGTRQTSIWQFIFWNGLEDEIEFYDKIIFPREKIMIKELECWLVKKQATFGTQGDDLDGGDYFPALPDSKLEIIPQFTDIESVSAVYDQDLSVKGFVNMNAELSCYMRSLGAATEPDYGLLAKASGWGVSGPTAGKYTYTPITAVSTKTSDDLEIFHYTGGIGENASILTKAGNIIGNWKIAGDVGKPVIFSLTGAKGIFVSQAAATMVTEIIKDRTLIPPALPVTVSINGVVYKVMKFSFEGGNSVEQYIDCAVTYGFGDSEITKKKIKFGFTCYANASLANPLDAVIAGDVVSDVELTWGKTLYQTKIDVDDPQFTDCKIVDVGGLTGWEVSGIATQNDIVITQNNDYE